MKKIGLLCGMSWHSSKLYYEYLNNSIANEMGELYNAHIIMNSLNSGYVLELLKTNKLETLKNHLLNEVIALEGAGADYIGITCNTVHYFFDYLQNNISTPIISIIDSTKNDILKSGLNNIGILASKFSLKNKLHQTVFNSCGIDTITPNSIEAQKIDDIIINLCKGMILESDKAILINIIKKLIINGAQGIVLGCTELSLIIKNDYFGAKIFDSALLHADILAQLCLERTNADYQAVINN